MGMKLRRCISVHRTGGIMLECCGDKLPGRLGHVIAAGAGLGVVLKLVKSEDNIVSMCFANFVVAAHKSRQRNGLRGRKGGVPACAMLNGRDCPSLLRLVFMDGM